MEKLRIGIAGVGNMGRAHAVCLADGKVGNAELACLCDIDKDKAAALRNEFPVPVFGSFGEMAASGLCDAVIIATPHRSHRDIAKTAFEHSLNVLCEKPAGVSVTDARKMNAMADASGKVFAIMFNQRTNPLYAKARELVRSGVLGQPKRFVWIITNWYRTQYYYDSGDWRGTWRGEGGGILINQAPHNLDLWQWIFGMPEKIRATMSVGKYHRIEVEDDVTIEAEYKNGATASFIASTGEYPGTNRLEISGDLGKIVLEDKKLKWWKLEEPERTFCFESKEKFIRKPVAYSEITEESDGGAHRRIIENFAACVLNGEPLTADGREGIFELMISNAAYLSAWTGKTVTLPFNEDEFDKLLEIRAEKSPEKSISGEIRHENPENGYNNRWSVKW